MTTPAHNHDVRGPLAPPHRDALDLAMADAPVDGLLRQHAPVFALGGPGPRIVWASRAALTLFGVAGLAALTTAVLGSDSPGGQRLVELAVAPRRDDKPQLERLRFFFNATSGPLTCLTRRFVAPGGGPLLVVGVLGTRSCEKGDALQTLLTDEAAFVTAAHVEEIVQSAPRLDFAQAQADLAGRYGARTTLRFVWQTDALNAVVHIGPELAQLLGRAPVSPGDDLMQVLARDGIDPAGEVRAALAGQQTWSGLDSSWPLFGGFAQVPVRLAATPLLDADSRFAGYRGFGLVQIDRLSPRASLEPVAELPGTALERILPITLRQAKAVAMADLPQDVAAGTAYAGPHDGQGDQPAPQPPPHSGHDQDTADAELNFFDANEAVHLRSATHDHALKMQNEISEAFLQPEAGSYGTAPPLAVAAAPVLVLPPRSGTVLLRKSATLIPASQAGMNLPENYLPGHNLPESNLAGAALAGMDIVTVHPASPPAVLRPAWVTVSPDETVTLSPVERQAFRDIARALGARVPDDEPDEELLAAGTDAPKPQLHALDPEAEDSEPPLALPVANAGVQATLAEVAADFSTAEPAGDSDHRQDNDIHGRHVFAAGQASAPPEAAYAVPDGDDGAASLHRNAELLLDRLPVGVIVCRGEVPIYVNATQLDLLGYDSADDFYAHGGLARMFRGRQPEALDPGTNGGAVPIVTADGEVLSVDARLQTISWDDLPATLITFRRAAEPDDVPRLRAMEMDVRARETELRELHAILDTATDGVAVIDDGGRILSLNRSAQAVFG